MKKKLSLLFVALLAMTAFASVWRAANRAPQVTLIQEWDFTKAFSAADLANLQADATNWNDENGDQTRFGNAAKIDEVGLSANGQPLEWTKGLVFASFKAGNKVRLNPSKNLGLNGNNLSVRIPVQAGDKVTVVWQTAKSSESSRYLSAENLNVMTGFKDPGSSEIQTSDGYAIETGWVTITTTGGGINIFSIKTEAVTESDPEPQPTVETKNITLDFTTQGYENGQEMTYLNVDGVEAKFGLTTEGGNTAKYYNTGSAVRVYYGGIVEVYSNMTIKEIKFVFGDGDGTNTITSDKGQYDSAGNTWTGSEKFVTFNVGLDANGTKKGNRRIQRILVTVEETTTPIPTPSGDTWTVAGDNETLFGTVWDPTNAANDMTLGADYFFNKTGVTLSQGTVEFKVVKNHSWNENYGNAEGGNYVLNIPEDGVYDISIIFSPATKTINAQANKTKDAELPDATIEKVVLLGSFNNWNTEAEGMQKVGDTYVWTTILDGKEITSEIEFKLLVNGNNWLGMANSASLAIEELGEHGPWHYGVDNIVLNHPITGYDTYAITAVWTPNSNAASGWKLTIAGKDAHKEDVPVEVKEGDDIAAAVAAAADKTNANITINLTENKTYELSQPLVVNNTNNLIINGNGATIDASKIEGTPALIKYVAPDAGAAPRRAPATPAEGWTYIDNVTIKDVTITGIKGSIFYDDNKKICVDNFTIDNAVLGLATEAVDFESLIAFQAGGIKDFTIKNSTVYGNNAVAKYFIRYNNNNARIDRYGYTDAADTWSMTYTNNTFYGLLKEEGQWGNYNGVQQKAGQMILTIKDNIWYNCDANTMRRLTHSKAFANFNANSTMSNNTFWRDGEAVDQGSYGNGTDIATEPKFNDAANGDFTLGDCEQAEKGTGDARWLNPIPGTIIWSNAEGQEVDWGTGKNVQVGADAFANVNAGDVLHIGVLNAPADANPGNWAYQIMLQSPVSWEALEPNKPLPASGNFIHDFVITGDMLKIMKTDGLAINGTKFNVKKISVEPKYASTENSIWVGEATLTWTQISVADVHFKHGDAKYGKSIDIFFEPVGGTPNIQLRTGWTDKDVFYGSEYAGTSPLRVPLTEEIANTFKEKGLIINANNIKITSIELNSYTDIAQMNAMADGTEFTLDEEAIVIAKEKKGNRTYVYIKDAASKNYSLIFDNDGSKTADLAVGKTIKAGWKGQVSIYKGLFEVIPAEVLAAGADQEFEYAEAKTIKVFNANNVNKIYKVKDITLSDVNKANFNVKKGNQTIVGYNQFDGVLIEEGLVCDEVIAAVGIYDGNVQLQPISIKANVGGDVTVNATAGGDLNEAVANARKGKNPKTLTINLAMGNYTISKPIYAYGDVTINGNGANIDASGLTDPMIQMSTYPSVAGTNVDGVTAYQVGNVELNEINVDNLSQNLFDCNKTNYLFENVTLNKSIIAIKGASKKTIFNFNGGGNTKNLTVSGSTLYADDATVWQNGGFFSTQSSKSVLQLGGTEEKTTIENSTFYNIAKGKTVSTLVKNSQAWMTYEVKSCLIVNSGKSGQFLAGLNAGQKGANSNWIVDNCSFTYDGQDVAATEATKIKDNVMTNTVYGVPFFRKNIEEGDFTLGVCPQIGKNVGDPRWYNIPMITKLQNALHRAAALLDGAQADWQSAPAANEAIEKLSGAYNENAPYLNSYYQEEIDEATLRMEAAIAEFEMVYGSDVTAIKSVDALKADGTWYTINGQRISKPTEKGIYIHNGRKVVVK